MDKDIVVGSQAGVIMEPLPAGQAGERQRRRENVGNLPWPAGQVAGWHGDEFGRRAQPIKPDQAEHLITVSQVRHARAARHHDPGHLV